jgi:hypothetical protein
MKWLYGKKELMLLHKVKCRLNIHDDNKVFDPNEKSMIPKHKLRKTLPFEYKLRM